MKKTLITLAALAMASVASAADTVVNEENPTSGSTYNGTLSTNNALTLALVVDWDKALTALGDWQAKKEVAVYGPYWTNAIHMFDGGEGSTTLNAGIYVDANSEKFYLSEWTSNATVTSTGISYNSGNVTLDKDTFCIDGKLILGYTYDDAAATFTLSALKADGGIGTMTIAYDTGWGYSGSEYSSLTVGSGVTDGVVERVVAINGALSGDALKYAMQTSIPEPTTATLSLLALAGLAARRRRK